MLTVVQERLAEAHGLALAAPTVTTKVEQRLTDAPLRYELGRMRHDAEETRARCVAAAGAFGHEPAAEMLAHANTTRERAADLAGVWFKAGTGPLSAWSFLAMAEAAEVVVWAALAELAVRTIGDGVAELAAWALPIQQRHLATALEGAVRLGQLTDPVAPRWG